MIYLNGCYWYILGMSTDHTITVTVEQHEGQMAALPVCARAEAFCQLIRRGWLSPSDMKIIQKIGFEIIEKNQPGGDNAEQRP